jgi:hypothetical protein
MKSSVDKFYFCKSLNDATTGDAEKAARWVEGSTGQRHAINKVKEKSIELQK